MTATEPRIFNSRERTAASVKRITLFGLAVNIFLSIIKFILGVSGNSQALIADAVHSFSDLTTDLAVIFGADVWSKCPDKNHPYGHTRIETLVTGGIGIMLLAAAAGIGYNALATIQHDHTAEQPGWIAFWGALLSIILKEFLYRWTLGQGRKYTSRALIANAWHHRTDALSSIPVAIAVIVSVLYPKLSFIDHIAAFTVSLFILYAGGKILKSVIEEVTETGASPTYLKKIEEIILNVKGVKSVHALRSRRMGSGWFIDLHVQVDPDLPVRKGHKISQAVEDSLIENNPEIYDVIVHIEPHEE